MFKTYLKIAFRNIKRYSTYSILNISGMAIGMVSAILILLWVQDECSYDRNFKNAGDLYRVIENQHLPGREGPMIVPTPGALTIAWYVMNKWLQKFAYRTDISLWIFIISGIIALIIALLTVGFQSFKAARKNPVEALRYE
jgi:putative ABC transport system permease protein